MAYSPPPGKRMGWDEDGTIMVIRRTETTSYPWQEVSATYKAILNSEDPTSLLENELDPASQFNNHDGELCLIFPELRELDGVFVQTNDFGGSQHIGAVDDSADTTNGFDGTFSNVIANMSDVDDDNDAWRAEITSVSRSSKRALRIAFDSLKGSAMSFRMLHVYGEISAGETPDRLIFIDEGTGLEFTLPWDAGDVPRGSAREFQFRLKNNSTAAGNNRTLNTISFTAESLYLTSGSWYTFSVGGDSYAATKNISSLAPEATTSLIVGRQIIPTTADLRAHSARIEASVGSVS